MDIFGENLFEKDVSMLLGFNLIDNKSGDNGWQNDLSQDVA